MKVEWDEEKNDWLKRHPERGVVGGFEPVQTIFNQDYVPMVNPKHPDQLRAIGYVANRLVTLVYEDISDENEEIYFLRTYWLATREETAIYDARKGRPSQQRGARVGRGSRRTKRSW